MSISDNDIASFYPHLTVVPEEKKFHVVEETEFDGSKWFCITVHTTSLDNWLQNQCEENEEKCFEGSVPWANARYSSCYNLHESLFMYVSLKWG